MAPFSTGAVEDSTFTKSPGLAPMGLSAVKTTASFAAPQPKAPIPEFRKGDMVQHNVFGNGMVLSVLKMGNDAMLEIAFDQVGTKRLMAAAAAARMKKM